MQFSHHIKNEIIFAFGIFGHGQKILIDYLYLCICVSEVTVAKSDITLTET